MAAQGQRKDLYQGFGDGFVLAVEFVIVVLLGVWLGHFLDGRLHTAPWFLVGLLVFTFTGGVARTYYAMRLPQHDRLRR